jgi:2-phospho-L-lactate/phosphoenolpyruvate guanylyltransferase
MIIAAVPVKDLANAKQRLTELLTPRERSLLARAMLHDVLRAFRQSTMAEPWVITGDAEVEAIARAHAVRPLREDANRGHTAAVAFAQREAGRLAADAFLTIPGDVPCVTGQEIDALATAARGRMPTAVFTASRSGLGTNGVALGPVDAMPLTFGEPSFANHVALARARGLVTSVLPLSGLSLDVDTPDDLRMLLAEPVETESLRLVVSWRLAERAAGVALTRS